MGSPKEAAMPPRKALQSEFSQRLFAFFPTCPRSKASRKMDFRRWRG